MSATAEAHPDTCRCEGCLLRREHEDRVGKGDYQRGKRDGLRRAAEIAIEVGRRWDEEDVAEQIVFKIEEEMK